jgi:hypothetical protein
MEYVAVPPVTGAGTFMKRSSVEFWPFMGGSGPNENEVILKREVDFEQSVTEAFALSNSDRIAKNIYMVIRQKV